MDQVFPEWAKALAGEVHVLVDKPEGMSRFREMVEQWVERKIAIDDEREARERDRQRHWRELAKLPEDHPLRKKSKTPPRPGWQDEADSYHEEVPMVERELKDGSGTKRVPERWPPDVFAICGWVPPELVRVEEVRLLPLGDRELELDEKYMLLAAIHNAVLKGVAKIDPWAGCEVTDLAMFARCIVHTVFCRNSDIPSEIEGHEAELRIFLGHVKDDLREQIGGEDSGEGRGPEDGETPGTTPDNDASLIYQADVAEMYNIPKSTLSNAAKKDPGEPGYLWSGRRGKRVWYRKKDVVKVSRSRRALGRR